MTSPIYNADYFIAKFEAIPEEMWCEGRYERRGRQYCALGHCGENNNSETAESSALYYLFVNKLNMAASDINDGIEECYPQPTPKQRILAALRDIKAKEGM